MKATQFIKDHGVEKARKGMIYGVGINDLREPVCNDGEKLPQYTMWQRMLSRAYSKSFLGKRPTYVGTSVCDRWLRLSNFMQDVQTIENYDKAINSGWQLDKDVLTKGNKHYSLSTCCFVPREINTLLINSKKTRGEYPIGVFYDNRDKKIRACVKIDKRNKFIGSFNNVEDAFQAYKQAKEHHIKEVAERWKGIIADNVYQALINWKVEITD